MTTADSEWTFPNAATAPGSGSYYAVRFSPAATRNLHAMQLAWYGLIQGIARRPTDPGVARLKLDWWHDEIDRGLRDRAPRHPLMTGLVSEDLASAAATPMHAIIDAAERRILQPSLPDAQAFRESCRASGGNLFRALCAVPIGATYDPERASTLGAFWEAIARLCESPADPALLPGAPERAPQEDDINDRRRTWFESLSRYPGEAATLRDEPVPDVARRLTAVALGLGRRLARPGTTKANQPVERAPIAHLWAAWRCR
jgi:hypothetical protein